MTSYRPDVMADSSGRWSHNTLRFRTERGALAYAADLANRWTLVTDIRVTLTDDPVAPGQWGFLDEN